MTDLKVMLIHVFGVETDQHYCLYDKSQGTFLSDGRRIRTYETKDGARGALSRVNHGQLPDKRK